MAGFREPSLSERQKVAANAKKAALEKFRAQPRPGEPAFDERQADRASHAKERAVAKQARVVAKAEKRVRDAEVLEHATRTAAAKTASDLAEQAARKVTQQAEQKAARDKRYADRKARTK
jgi:hypothetical protein